MEMKRENQKGLDRMRKNWKDENILDTMRKNEQRKERGKEQ
jgi:hypothetical protein